MSDLSGNDGEESGVAGPARRRTPRPLTIAAIVVGAVVVVGGGAALGVIVGQQHPITRAHSVISPAESASPESTGTPTVTATPGPSAPPTASPSLDWSIINGSWCSDIDCHTISNLTDERGEIYQNTTGLDANGCLVGIVGPPNDPTEGHTTYCPPGSPFISSTNPDCHMPEDVSRERLYLFIDCGDPYYRK